MLYNKTITPEQYFIVKEAFPEGIELLIIESNNSNLEKRNKFVKLAKLYIDLGEIITETLNGGNKDELFN